VLSKAFLYAGLKPDPGAGVNVIKIDQEHEQPSNPHVGLIEGPSEVFPSADDDIW
jgi:hypothetical protein